MTYSLDQFDFLALHGNPDPLKEEVLVLSRPGVDGVAVWKIGKRGQKFTLRSVCDARDIAHARDLFCQYKALIGADPVSLTWADLPLANESAKVVVLDVRAATLKTILGGVGGLNPPSTGWVECDWDLVAVEV